MSSLVGTAIPASRSTALSSAAVGFTRSIQTALSGSPASSTATFFSEDTEGTKTASMGGLRESTRATQPELARFLQAVHHGHTHPVHLAPEYWSLRRIWRNLASYPTRSPERPEFCGKNDTGAMPQ